MTFETWMARAQYDMKDGNISDYLRTAFEAGREAGIREAAKVAADDDGKYTLWGEDRNTKVAQATATQLAAAILAALEEPK